jgi:signal transduction histidine kinase
VQAHDGTIRVEGAPGGGAAVVIELPVGTPPSEGTP